MTAGMIKSAPPGLSRREVELLATWERARRRAVTLQDIRQSVGDAAAKKVAYSLVRKHALERVARGVYLVRPFRTLLRPGTSSSAVLISVFLHGESHYLGGLWALTWHGLTEQQHVSVIDAFVAKRHKAVPPSLAKVRFHRVSGASVQRGTQIVEIEQVKVHVSDPERTLLDLLDHPPLAGSISQAVTMVERSLERVDAKKLIAYAVRDSSPSTCQRLGVLLERRKIP
ncbi:MAG TPA: type IV toxin-antitoxin system AbiEi family antitoxin, partial [Myxococcales bacterium]|nr:type IV toxin-antitoxin system AbiEi family antitoxin [Myxococcales bacterium]